MLGDDAQPADEVPRARAATGPRHAAPRKSLLTKLHVPAGKAVALAAMPTAVLMGMGFTPHLAQADELPKSPYKPGPCVTQPDTPTPSATGKADATKDATGGKDTKGSGSTTAKGGSGGKDSTDASAPRPTTSPSATKAPAPTTSPSPAAKDKQPETAPTTSPSPTASPTKSVNPLDPLGLGDLLGGLLGLGGSGSSDSGSGSSDSGSSGSGSATATPTPTPSATKPAPTTTTAPPSVSDTVKSTVEGADKAVKGAEDAAGGAVKGATDGAKKATKDLGDAATSATGGTKDGSTTDPQAFPCPTYDAKALADAKTEPGIPLLADTPWILKSSLLTLYGLSYDGVVQVRTYNGTVKDVLKFTATGVDIGDLSQTVDGPDGTKTHVTARKGSTSTIRNGTVTMYTESISGNLLGIIPITFTPKAPPPVSLPVMFFTDATVIQAGQFGGDLTVPGMNVLPGQAS